MSSSRKRSGAARRWRRTDGSSQVSSGLRNVSVSDDSAVRKRGKPWDLSSTGERGPCCGRACVQHNSPVVVRVDICGRSCSSQAVSPSHHVPRACP